MDLLLIETLNGGDLYYEARDLSMAENVESMIYMGWFGGNPGFPTRFPDVDEESLDYWGNPLFMNDNPDQQFNSQLEYVLRTTPLTSNGRVLIESAAKQDLEFLNNYGTFELTVEIVSDDHIKIGISVKLRNGSVKVKMINLRKTSDGDFSIEDFSPFDFY